MENTVELGMLLAHYGALLTARQRKLLELYVNEDYSLAEIAEREGISRQGVHDALKRAKEQLYAYEQVLQSHRRSQDINVLLAQLRDCLQKGEMEESDKAVALALVDRVEAVWEEEYGV